MPDNRPFSEQQLDEWARATRDRGISPVSRETGAPVSRATAAPKTATPAQRRALQKQAKAFETFLKAHEDPREKKFDRLEKEFQRKERQLPGSVASARAETIVGAHQATAKKGKDGDWEEKPAQWGVGYGNVWADRQAKDAALKALKLKKAPNESDPKYAAYAKAFWAERNKITERLAGLEEMSCLTMMRQPLERYTKVMRVVLEDQGASEQSLSELMEKARDARGAPPKEVPEARGTVVLEELRKRFGFQTVHIDAQPSDPKKYWNNKTGWNYSSDRDAREKLRLPKAEMYRTVKGADSNQDIDVSVGIDHLVKLGKGETAESRKWWKVLNETEFAVGVADQGFHTFAISRGYVYEVHWDRGPDDPTLTGKRPLKDFFKPDRKANTGTGWSSGIIAVPPEALPVNAQDR